MLESFVRRWLIPVFGLLLVFICSNMRWGGKERWRELIQADAQGYYVYLPAIFVHHDVNISFYDSVEAHVFPIHKRYDYRATTPEFKIIPKYYCGTALCEAPFVLAAFGVDALRGDPDVGWTKLDFIAVQLAGIFWVCIGLVFLRKLLQRFGLRPAASSVFAVLVVVSTNLFYYIIGEPGQSHPFAFAMACIFMYYSDQWLQRNTNKSILLSALSLGVLILIRPIDGLIIFWLPFAAGSFSTLFTRIKTTFQKPKIVLLAALIIGVTISLQLLYYKVATGHWWVYAYGHEGFDFTNPELINFLFSYKKGWFVYTPIAFVSLFGLIFLWKKNWFQAIALFFFLFLVVYVLSSWWMWFYGGSFGCRVMIDFLPFIAILLGFLWQSLRTRTTRMAIGAVLFLLFAFNQIQTLEYRYTIIHWSEMTREKYWDVFLTLKK